MIEEGLTFGKVERPVHERGHEVGVRAQPGHLLLGLDPPSRALPPCDDTLDLGEEAREASTAQAALVVHGPGKGRVEGVRGWTRVVQLL